MPETAAVQGLTAALHEVYDEMPLLREQQHATAEGLLGVQREQAGVRQWMRRSVLTMIFGIFALGLGLACYLYTVAQQAEANEQAIVEAQRLIDVNNQRWCPLLTRLAPRPNAPAPAGTPEQQRYALDTRRALADLAHAYGCKTKSQETKK